MPEAYEYVYKVCLTRRMVLRSFRNYLYNLPIYSRTYANTFFIKAVAVYIYIVLLLRYFCDDARFYDVGGFGDGSAKIRG